MKTFTRVAAVAAAALVLAACGGDNGDNGADPGATDGAESPTETEDTEPDATETEGTEPDATEDDAPERLILGLVPSQDLDQLVLDADRLGELLAAELGVEVEALVTDNYAGLVVAMQTGQAHIGMFGPIALVQAVDQAGAEAVLQSVRRGTESYHTQWFTNDPDRFCVTSPPVTATNPEGFEFSYCNGTDAADAGPVGEEALALIESGETIMFVDEGSASGYYYPATQIETAAGLDPLTDIDAQFAGGHPNAALAVARGDASVGVSFDDVRNDLVEEDPEIGDTLVVFAWSSEIPNDGVAVAGDLSPEWQQRIADAFVALADTEEGAQALLDVYSIEGLVPADLDALDVARQVAANFGD